MIPLEIGSLGYRARLHASCRSGTRRHVLLSSAEPTYRLQLKEQNFARAKGVDHEFRYVIDSFNIS